MKKILLLLVFIPHVTLNAQAQTSKNQNQKPNFDSGTYTSSAKGQNIKLTLNEDKTYDMSFFFGNYEVKNDTIYFRNTFQNTQKIVIKPNSSAPYSSTLKLKLNYDLSYYYSSEVYIGTQTDENRKVNYKLIKDYFNPKNTDLTQQNIEVEKAKYLYVVDAKYNGTTVFKFQIPDTINEAELEYNPYTNSETKLSGYIDTNNEFVISDGKIPILFNFVKDDVTTPKINTNIIAIAVKSEDNWMVSNGFADAETVNTSGEETYKTPYTFVHKNFNSFNTAQSETKKTPNKFLVVAYDPKNKNAKKEFDEFITTDQSSISSYMYSEYNPSYDNFNFYLASDSDKKLLSKNNINSDQELLVFNASGDLVYHTKGSIDSKKDLFSVYNSIHKELKSANEQLELDKIIANKSASVKDLKSVLRKTISSETVYATQIVPSMSTVDLDYPAPPPPPVVKEVIQKDLPVVVEEVKADAEYAVDSATTVYEDNYYEIIKDKENLYSFKSKKEAVLEKWKKVFDFYKNSKSYDKEFVQIIKAELTDSGFTSRLFLSNPESTDMDFQLLDYVFSNFDRLQNPPAEPVVETVKDDASITADYEPYYYEQDIKTALNTHFSKANNLQNTQIDKVLTYYKKYLNISGFDANAMQNYMEALRQNIYNGSYQKEYLETFDSYFDSIVNDKSSIIENLDEAFSKKPVTDYADWTQYKNSFANLANDVSWFLVEKSNDAFYLKKAIKWSETSLMLEKNNHYYLDTLAQIYYKNGMKQKAIETEQKAIDAEEKGFETEEYKVVLEKMKNGTY